MDYRRGAPAVAEWVLGPPTCPIQEPTWPKQACFPSVKTRFGNAELTSLQANARGEPTCPPKSLKSNSEIWRRGWDSDPTRFCRFCKLQIPQCRGYCDCQRCRGALHAVARMAELRPLLRPFLRLDLPHGLCRSLGISVGLLPPA